MKQSEIDTFASCADDLRATVDQIVAAADGLRDLTADAQLKLAQCSRAVSVLRRTENTDMIGSLNSLSAASERHRSLGGVLTDLETALSRFEDVGRDMRLLHPSVVDALTEQLAASTLAAKVP